MANKITILHPSSFYEIFPKKDDEKMPNSIGIIRTGTEIPIKNSKEGFEFEKELTLINDQGEAKKFKVKSKLWHQDKNGWWYWDGATKNLEDLNDSQLDPITDGTIHNYSNQIFIKDTHKNKLLSAPTKKIKIGIIDVGFNLSHKALHHISLTAHKYDISDINTYDLDKLIQEIKNSATHSSNDIPIDFLTTNTLNITGTDKVSSLNSHGNNCLGILAGIDNSLGYQGIIPHAEFHLFKIKIASPKALARVLSLAVLLDVDIISSSMDFISATTNEIQEHFTFLRQKIKEKNISFFSTLNSAFTDSVTGLANSDFIPFPSSWDELIRVGALEEFLITSTMPASEDIVSSIHYVFPRKKMLLVDKASSNSYFSELCSCSYATPIAAGMAGLILAAEREEKQSPRFRFSKKEIQSKVNDLICFSQHNYDTSKNGFLKIEPIIV